ncbi:MAG TPA: hypothetical protein DCS54_07180 [Oribacterium sp.]|nr:hypothetical protein [Oribacterium sp.]
MSAKQWARFLFFSVESPDIAGEDAWRWKSRCDVFITEILVKSSTIIESAVTNRYNKEKIFQ